MGKNKWIAYAAAVLLVTANLMPASAEPDFTISTPSDAEISTSSNAAEDSRIPDIEILASNSMNRSNAADYIEEDINGTHYKHYPGPDGVFDTDDDRYVSASLEAQGKNQDKDGAIYENGPDGIPGTDDDLKTFETGDKIVGDVDIGDFSLSPHGELCRVTVKSTGSKSVFASAELTVDYSVREADGDIFPWLYDKKIEIYDINDCKYNSTFRYYEPLDGADPLFTVDSGDTVSLDPEVLSGSLEADGAGNSKTYKFVIYGYLDYMDCLDVSARAEARQYRNQVDGEKNEITGFSDTDETNRSLL